MKKIIFAAALALSLNAFANNDWLHIYTNGGKLNTGELKDVEKIDYRQWSENDTLYDVMNVTRSGKTANFSISDIDSVVIGTNVPTMYIDIENGAEVLQKDVYLNATVKVDCYGAYDDFEPMAVTIKGRGNSTWNMDKKPYRLKFAKKQQMCGLKKSKNFCLIANFIDCTMMRNAVAFKMARLLEMPYTNSAIPINVVINGTYRGAYMLTEKIGINGASVDIDETTGILFEFDTNYDEPYKFHSNKFSVPVMVKDPDFNELAVDPTLPDWGTAAEHFQLWKDEFHAMENTLSSSGTPSADLENKLDIQSVVDYMIVCNITGNREPHHPKSVYMYKSVAGDGDKFHLGPVWDFDWAYTFDGSEGTGSYSKYLFADSGSGTSFFKAVFRSAKFKELYAQRWNELKTTYFEQLMQFIDEYAALTAISAYQNGEKWPAGFYNYKYNLKSTATFSTNVEDLKKWMKNRLDWCDKASNWGLYQY